ncbi:MAG: phosphonate ABC transporter, permease protein PhnE [Devosia sp.]
MADISQQSGLSPASETLLRHYRSQVMTRRVYSLIAVAGVIIALFLAMNYANSANSGKFFDRLPYMFDFIKNFLPRDPFEIFRAMFSLESPYFDGSAKYNYTASRVYITDTFYIPHLIYQLVVTVNIAIVSTIIGGALAFALCFFAATNLVGAGAVRWFMRRTMEVLRAFPEIVIAGMLTAILSIGPIAAIIAISVHTIGALGKLFFEVVENADMKPDEGLKSVGATWLERVRYAIVPQVMPNFVSYGLLRMEINVRASTIIGAVGGGGIGEVFRLSIGRDYAAQTYAIIIMLLVTIIIIDQFSGWLRRRLVGNQGFNLAKGSV